MRKTTTADQRLDMAQLRARLGSARGPQFWRSLEEAAETEEFQRMLECEFPEPAAGWKDDVGRRRFLQLMGASLALAGFSGCTRQPEEKIVPFARTPESLVPGKPLYFATALTLGGFATGVLAESHMGRPTKIEGNPEHPASLGATDALTQASILTLYDPDRSQVVTQTGNISRWLTFVGALNLQMEAQRLSDGAGLRVLTETVTSPALGSQLDRLLEEFPAAKWLQYEPAGRDAAREGARLAFGEPVHAYYRFDQADIVVSLDADFLSQGPGSVRYGRDFMARRRPSGGGAMNRLYVAEGAPSNTGAMADHRLRLRAGRIQDLAAAIAQGLGVPLAAALNADFSEQERHWIDALVRDLRKHQGSAIVVAGDQQPAAVHALAHAVNQELGAIGRTVVLTEPVEYRPVNQLNSIQELAEDMDAGRVEVLVIAGGNPVFDAPADLNFAERLSKVKFRVHFGLYDDETSRLCHWHIPAAHELESWGDARAYDGTASIIQPLIAPLYDGISVHKLLAALMGSPERSGHDVVREYWRDRVSRDDFESFWSQALHDGLIPGTAAAPKSVSVRSDFTNALGEAAQEAESPPGGLEISFRPDPCIWDGRFANNAWLQELPKPNTKLTWDNAALISPSTAERLGLASEDVVILRLRGRSVEAPVWITPGHADESVTVTLGYGRSRVGRVGQGAGFDAYLLRAADAMGSGSGLEIEKAGRRYRLASTQLHHNMEGRHLVRAGSIEQFRENPHFASEMGHSVPKELTLYPEFEYKGYSWGMAVDLNSCIGCNACVVACGAENNVPVAGKDQVIAGREMHWIRVDRYYEGGLDDPGTYYQPVMCMHCENAPCEPVCPVGATMHDSEGLNVMVYNRCVGTRYCSNNCPYKVRRFNFFPYSDYETPSLKLLHNPDVTVRTRGVMEKCTYCVQRINAARIASEKEGRAIQDGEVRTACQQVCPTEAIVFGDINDPESRVSKLKADSRNYGLLADINTRPRTSYLARLSNPNPEIPAESAHE